MNRHCYLLLVGHQFVFCTILQFMFSTLHLMKCISRTNFNTVTIGVLKLKQMKVMLYKFILHCYNCTNFVLEIYFSLLYFYFSIPDLQFLHKLVKLLKIPKILTIHLGGLLALKVTFKKKTFKVCQSCVKHHQPVILCINFCKFPSSFKSMNVWVLH